MNSKKKAMYWVQNGLTVEAVVAGDDGKIKWTVENGCVKSQCSLIHQKY